MSTEYEVGDKVRVTYEGHVAHAGGSNILSMGGYALPKSGATITVIEKAKKPLEVGDVVRVGEFEACPVGTVLHDPSDGEVLLRVPRGWRRADRDQFVGHVNLACERVIVHLPTA